MATIPRPFDLKSQGAPNVSADVIDAFVWQQQAFGGALPAFTVNATSVGGLLLWLPANLTLSALIYGMVVSTTATSSLDLRLGYFSATTGWSSNAGSIASKHFSGATAVRAPSAQLYSAASGISLPSAGNYHTAFYLSNSTPFQFFAGMANVVLRSTSASGSGLGIIVNNTGGSGVVVSFTVDWMEFSVT